jgi:hypothetical protein
MWSQNAFILATVLFGSGYAGLGVVPESRAIVDPGRGDLEPAARAVVSGRACLLDTPSSQVYPVPQFINVEASTMIRLPRFLPIAVIVVTFSLIPVASTDAQPARPGQNSVDAQLMRDVENFWHYAKIARYDVAREEARKILARADQPVAVLEAFEQGPGRRDTLEDWLLRWHAIEDMREPTAEIIRLLNEGRFTRRADPEYIIGNIRRLSTGERAYMIGIQRLRESGELAVPFMIDLLRNPQERELHPFIRRGLRDLGRLALNPLVAATEMQDGATLTAVAAVLGDIGYDVSVPYLVRMAKHSRYNEVQTTAQQALGRLGVTDVQRLNVSDLFYDLAERFYYNTAAISADIRQPIAYVWYWQEGQGLVKTDVPPAIFNEIMAMRAAEYTLEHDAEYGPAVSLWLAANYNREIELPEGQVDRTRGEGQPDAHYYGVFAGTDYLNSALARALNDRNPPLALRVVQSLQEIVGESNLFIRQQNQPIIDAMRFPDRLVRYQAAFTLAAALPQNEFDGQGRVVPLLADAIGQSGRPNVLLVMPDRDALNRVVQGLQDEFGVAGGTSSEEALAQAYALPSVDVIIIAERLDAGEIDRLLTAARQDVRLEATPRLIVTETRASEWARRAVQDPLIFTVTGEPAADPTMLRDAIESTRQAAALLPLDQQQATELALEASRLLERLAISRGQVLDVLVAEPALLRALNDARPEVVIAVGGVLGVVDSGQAQAALLDKAVQDDTDDAVRIALYRSMASSAKFFGNRLDEQQVATLQQAVNQAQNLDVRSAAAEAHGALNLPADQAKQLITRQARR